MNTTSLTPIGHALCLLSLTCPGLAQDEEAQIGLADNPLDTFERLTTGQWRSVDPLLAQYSRYDWGPGRRVLDVTTWQLGDGVDQPVSEGLVYWHPGREAFAGTMVLVGGRLKDLTIEPDGDQWDWNYGYYSGGSVNKMLDSWSWAEEAKSYKLGIFFMSGTPMEWMTADIVQEERGGSALPTMPTDDGESANLGMLEPLVGNWATSRTHADGTETSGRTVCYWGVGRDLMHVRAFTTVDGEEQAVAEAMIYWHPAEKERQFVAVDITGALDEGALDEKGGGLDLTYERFGGEGGKFVERIDFPEGEEATGFSVKTWKLVEVEGERERELVAEATYTVPGGR